MAEVCIEESSRNKLKGRIEEHLFNELQQDTYSIYEDLASSLLTPNRFDLAIKLLYLSLKEKFPEYAKKLYINHINAFSYGEIIEAYNDKKKGESVFIQTFNQIASDIATNGFNSKKSLLVLGNDGVILNGAHRTAAAIFHRKQVRYLKTELSSYFYPSRYFYDRAVPLSYLLHAAHYLVVSNERYALSLGTERQLNDLIKLPKPVLFFAHALKLTNKGRENLNWYLSEGQYVTTESKMFVFVVDLKLLKEQGFPLHEFQKRDQRDLSAFLLNPNTNFLLNTGDFRQCTIAKSNSNISTNEVILHPLSAISLFGVEVAEVAPENLDAAELYKRFPDEKDILGNPEYYYYFKGVKIGTLQLFSASLKAVENQKELRKLLNAVAAEEKRRLRSYRTQAVKFKVNKYKYTFLKQAGNLFRKVGIYDLMNKIYTKSA